MRTFYTLQRPQSTITMYYQFVVLETEFSNLFSFFQSDLRFRRYIMFCRTSSLWVLWGSPGPSPGSSHQKSVFIEPAVLYHYTTMNFYTVLVELHTWRVHLIPEPIGFLLITRLIFVLEGCLWTKNLFVRRFWRNTYFLRFFCTSPWWDIGLQTLLGSTDPMQCFKGLKRLSKEFKVGQK